MRRTDVCVIGGGFAGLMAALFAARGGRSVRVLARGHGALAISGSGIDVLGYVKGRPKALRRPLDGIPLLPGDHPYRLAGVPAVKAALRAFADLCAEAGAPYDVDPERPLNRPAYTTIGTMKPVCAFPLGEDFATVERSDAVLVVGMDGLKDFHPTLAARGLGRLLRAEVTPLLLPAPPALRTGPHARDVAALDVARWLDRDEHRAAFATLLRREAAFAAAQGEGVALLLPPVLGRGAGPAVRTDLQDRLGACIRELVAPPPAVSGLRLRASVMTLLSRAGVEVTYGATVTGVETSGRRVDAVLADCAGVRRRVGASAFVVATGGIHGEGLVVGPRTVSDAVFGDAFAMTSDLTPTAEGWADESAYPDFGAGREHAFERIGVRTDASFRPLGRDGGPVFDNAFYAGRAVGGYNPSAEKSGNGVALVTAFVAAAGAVEAS